MVTRKEVIKVARSYLGTPFAIQGRSPGVFLDCVGVLVCMATDLGLPCKDFDAYTETTKPEMVREMLACSMDEIPVEEAIPGDVLMFEFSGGGDQAGHVGVLSEPERMIHTWPGATWKVCENSLGQYWRNRICSAHRFRGLED